MSDLRFGLRMLAKNPGTTVVTVLTLALALGVNTAIFSVLNATLLRLLPAPKAEQLVILTDPNASMVLGGMLLGERSLLTFPEFVQLRDGMKTVAGLCASQLTLETWPIQVGRGAQKQVRGRIVSENYFTVFGVKPAVGRFFRQTDATGVGKDPYAVISYDFWQRRFGGSQTIIGKSFRLHGTSYAIIGVAAPGFHGETVGQEPDVWLPMMMQPLAMLSGDGLKGTLGESSDKLMWLHAFGRRKAGVTVGQVQAEASVLFRRILEADYPATMQKEQRAEALRQFITVRPLATGAFHGRKEFAEQWLLLLGLAGLVLLVACANVANLLLARAVTRTHEVAIRLAMGAARSRLLWQFMTESLVLAMLGGIGGFLVAQAGMQILLRMLSASNPEFSIAASIDWRVLGFSAVVTLAAGLLLGLAPALRASGNTMYRNIKETGRGAMGSRDGLGFARILVIAQIALSLLLAIGAGLFVRSLWKLESVALGYPKEKLLLVGVDSSGAGYRGERDAALHRDMVRRISEIPGVRGVSYSDRGIFSGFDGSFAIGEVEGFTSNREKDEGSTGDSVAADYFSTVGIPLLLGREFNARDMSGPTRVTVINEAFAKQFFGGGDPIGRHFTAGLSDENGNSGPRRLEVIGLAKDVRVRSLRGPIDAKFYVPGGGSWFEVRTAGDPNRLIAAVRRAILAIDGDLAIKSVKTLSETVNEQNAQPRFIAQLASLFGMLALVLSAVGVYSLLSYGVARRKSEIGVRLALGADGRRITGMILKETGGMIAWGVITGIAATAMLARVLSTQLSGGGAEGARWSLARYQQVESATQLYGLSAMDAWTFGIVVAVLAVVGLVAAFFPAARAAKVDPVEALRAE